MYDIDINSINLERTIAFTTQCQHEPWVIGSNQEPIEQAGNLGWGYGGDLEPKQSFISGDFSHGVETRLARHWGRENGGWWQDTDEAHWGNTQGINGPHPHIQAY